MANGETDSLKSREKLVLAVVLLENDEEKVIETVHEPEMRGFPGPVASASSANHAPLVLGTPMTFTHAGVYD